MVELWKLALGLAGLGTQFNLGALGISWFYRPPRRTLEKAPPISILIPCEGAEEGLESHLRSALEAPYPAARQVIFCVPQENDPAMQVILKLLEALQHQPRPDVEACWVSSAREPADLNRKVRHLRAGSTLLKHEVVVAMDSDVLLEAETLTALVGALVMQPGAGLAYAPPRFPERGGLAHRLLAYGFSASPHAFYTLKALADFTNGERPVVGSLVCYHKRTLEAFGGYRQLGGHIGDDLELGRQVEKLGLKVVVSPVTASCPDPDLDLKGLFQKLHRWIVVGGAYGAWRLFSYPLLLAPLPLILLLWGASVWQGEQMPSEMQLLPPVLLVWRLLFGGLIGLLYRRKPSLWDPILLLSWDLLLTVASLKAMLRPEVVWRGRWLRIRPGGGILPLQDPTRPGVPEVPARNNLLGDLLLPPYARWLTRSHLANVWVRGLEQLTHLPPDQPVILTPNHSCWWDGILAFVINDVGLGRDFYIMMEDRQLRRYQFFAWAGAFSIRRQHLRSAGQTLRYVEELLSSPGRSLWLFPQGVMVPEGRRPLAFESGVGHLAKRISDVRIIPVTMTYLIRSNPRPEAFISLGRPLVFEQEQLDAQGFTHLLEQQVQEQLDSLKHELTQCPLEQVPTGFECLLEGRRGVAETWDRVRASVGLLRN